MPDSTENINKQVTFIFEPMKYHPEPYWNEVAKKISERDYTIIAGDDEPFYRYKRKKFLKLFRTIDFNKKIVFELGQGPGGNLLEVLKQQPKELIGADISEKMIMVAEKNLPGFPVTLKKINGHEIPLPDQYADLSYTSTVLQHNTDEEMLKKVVAELCRVTKHDVYIFEKIEKEIKGTAFCLGRPISYYENVFAENRFQLTEVRFLNIGVSYFVSGTIRKLFNSKKRKEGDPVSKTSSLLQKLTLPFTSVLDKIFTTERELAMLHFKAQ